MRYPTQYCFKVSVCYKINNKVNIGSALAVHVHYCNSIVRPVAAIHYLSLNLPNVQTYHAAQGRS